MTSSNSNSNSSLTLKYGVEGNWAGHTKNTIDVRLIGPGVDHFAQYPVNAANEDALVRSVNRLIYIETTPWHQCKDQLGFWNYPELGHAFEFRAIKLKYIRFNVQILDATDEPVETVPFKIKRENFEDFVATFELGVNLTLRPDLIEP